MHDREKQNATLYNSRVPKTCFGYASFSLYNKYNAFHKVRFIVIVYFGLQKSRSI